MRKLTILFWVAFVLMACAPLIQAGEFSISKAAPEFVITKATEDLPPIDNPFPRPPPYILCECQLDGLCTCEFVCECVQPVSSLSTKGEMVAHGHRKGGAGASMMSVGSYQSTTVGSSDAVRVNGRLYKLVATETTTTVVAPVMYKSAFMSGGKGLFGLRR